MNKIPVIVVFDIGKTNKKLFLFDEDYKILKEESIQIDEIRDEDGDPCEDLATLSNWIEKCFKGALALDTIEVRAVNFSAYGASLVHINENGIPLAFLYNYLKPYPERLQEDFYQKYGGRETFAQLTASPALGSLNSGLQLYRLKNEKPELFQRIRLSLHLPQYLSAIISRQFFSDITSLGCHTALWDFQKNNYHHWVEAEAVLPKMAPIFPSDAVLETGHNYPGIRIGIGLHDSSAALIPYQTIGDGSFILISTGTWSISLNPFNQSPLRKEELAQDCLCYLEFRGGQVKASRLFAGHYHDQQSKRLSDHFRVSADHYKQVAYDEKILNRIGGEGELSAINSDLARLKNRFGQRDLTGFKNYEEAYHRLILDIMCQQVFSTKLVMEANGVKRIFVDGGFSKNQVYLHLLARAFPDQKIYAARIAQASALGAALAIHPHWNRKKIPEGLVEWDVY